ncbi:MAG TPA: M2 family metallopeptidase, partial [Brevundimonas sp.]|nr:M2 family metallopeptidase [Brevundimonas sp.]
MKRTLMTAAALGALSLGMAACASDGASDAQMRMAEDVVASANAAAGEASAQGAGAQPGFPATADGAAAFVADAETRLAALSEEAARIQWTRATNITHDTMWLESRINAEYTELQVELANGAARFNDVDVPADVRRKLNLLRL